MLKHLRTGKVIFPSIRNAFAIHGLKLWTYLHDGQVHVMIRLCLITLVKHKFESRAIKGYLLGDAGYKVKPFNFLMGFSSNILIKNYIHNKIL